MLVELLFDVSLVLRCQRDTSNGSNITSCERPAVARITFSIGRSEDDEFYVCEEHLRWAQAKNVTTEARKSGIGSGLG